MDKYRVKQNEKNSLWYLQRRTFFNRWIDVKDFYTEEKITDASWAGIREKADRWVFENVVKTNWRYHR